MVVCRYSSVISSHYLGGQDILIICRAMRGPKKCRIKVLPMGHSGHFTNYANRIFGYSDPVRAALSSLSIKTALKCP